MTLSYERIIIRPQVNRVLAQELQAEGIPLYEKEDLISAKEAGRAIFRQSGERKVTLGNILDDIEALGYALSNINLLYVKTVRKRYLYMTFEQKGQKIDLTPQLQELIQRVFGRIYAYMHVYVNPDGSATVNPVSAIFDPEDPLRELRISEGGEFFVR